MRARLLSSLLFGLPGALGCGGAALPSGGADGGDASYADGGVCQPVAVPDAAPSSVSACSELDAGSCRPGDVAEAALSWVPPRAPQHACATGQIAAFYAACTDPGGSTPAACAAFESDAANVPCFDCLTSVPGDGAYGPLIVDKATSGAVIDVAGCIATLDPCNATCAHATLAKDQCLSASCAACTALAADNACTLAAAVCPCAAYEAAVESCWSALLAAGSPAAPCLASGFQPSFTAVATALCASP
jgi:hypothetical protein